MHSKKKICTTVFSRKKNRSYKKRLSLGVCKNKVFLDQGGGIIVEENNITRYTFT